MTKAPIWHIRRLWHTGCRCTQCRAAHAETQRAFGRARAQQRLPVEVRQQLLDAIYAGQPFRTTLRDRGLTPNRVWSSAWHYSGLCAWLRLHGVSGTSAPAHGEEPQGRAVEKLLHRDWRSPVMAIERAEISLLPWFRSPHREAPPATSPVVEQGEYVRPTSGAFTCSQKALGFETLGVSCLHTVGSPGPA